MGAGASSTLAPEGNGGTHDTAIDDLPESCVAVVMLHLDPPGICRLARLSRTFRAAATGDFVWETKLPINYHYLLKKTSVDEDEKDLVTKMEIYAKLCRRNPFDGGTKVRVTFVLLSYHLLFHLCFLSFFVSVNCGFRLKTCDWGLKIDMNGGKYFSYRLLKFLWKKLLL